VRRRRLDVDRGQPRTHGSFVSRRSMRRNRRIA
jgi:hypothetical protein